MTNNEVLAVNQKSTNNKQLFSINNNTQYAWVADAPGSKDKYVALFTAAPPPPPRVPRQGGSTNGQPRQPGQSAQTPPVTQLPATVTPPVHVNPADTLPAKVTVSLTDLGFKGKCSLRDFWAHKNLGTVQNEISAVINSDGTVLYCVSPVK